MKSVSVIAVLTAVFGVALGTLFSLFYDMVISEEVALILALVGLVLAMGSYGIWRRLRRGGTS